MKDIRTPRVLFAAIAALVLAFSQGYGLSPAGPLPSGDAAVETPPGEWLVECADCPPNFGPLPDRALRIDAAGTLHAAFGGDHLYYARQVGSGWQVEIVDGDSPVGEGSVLALDAGGRPHITYRDASQDRLKYAWHDGSAWHVEAVVAGGSIPSLALDGSGWPHIVFRSTDGSLAHAWPEAGSWQVETADAVPVHADYVSLAIDGAGELHVAYHDTALNDLKYARHDLGGWRVETVDSFWNVGQYCSLAVDAAGHPHISYQSHVDVWPEPESLKVAWHDGSVWHTETVVSGFEGDHTSFALDAAGRPHISYVHPWVVGGLTHTWHDGNAWQVEAVPDPVMVGPGTSLALDAQGRPHVLFLDMPDGRHRHARHAWHDGTAWQAEYVLLGGSVGDYPSLAIDSAGRTHIAYGEIIGPSVKYAWHDGADWQWEWVDREGRLGGGPSLMLDAQDQAHVSYHTSAGLKYARRDGAGWHIEPVDSVEAIQAGTALALDAAGQPRIAYGHAGGIRYAWHDDAGWHTQDVSAEQWPLAVTLALDPAGHPHLAYYSGDLFYAWNDGTGWQVESIGPGVANFSNRWLALDGAGQPHVVFWSGYLLTHAWRDEGEWRQEPVGLVDGWYPSLVLDASGWPHVSYISNWFDGGTNWWRAGYARRTAAGWQVDTFGAGQVDYEFTALALDQAGAPRIAYKAASLHRWGENYRLLVAERQPGPATLSKQASPAHGVYAGEPITYTLTLDGPGRDVELWDPLPGHVEYISGTVTPPAVYSPTLRAIVWHGTLPTATVQTVQFQVMAAFTGTAALPIVNTAWLTDVASGSAASATAIVNGTRFYLPLVVKQALTTPIVAH